MMIKIRNRSDPLSSQITPESVYKERRTFIKKSGQFALTGLVAGLAGLGRSFASAEHNIPQLTAPNWLIKQVNAHKEGKFRTSEKLTPYEDVTTYNNFYEFGTGKKDPSRYSGDFKTEPWLVAVEGEVAKPAKYHLEDLLKPYQMEDRIYRLRCVEAWSMVIPWVGIPLADMLKRFEPTSKAKFVEFTTIYDPKQMPGQNSAFTGISFPYVEGLRIDEAMNPLTFMVTGLYGKTLPNQDGAPFRLIVPWKYGFKSIKSIVKIRLTETQPKTTWQSAAPNEYGFYANVNPQVDHPRWSQKHERRLPSTLFSPNRIETRLFNGYEEEVAHLYRGMDLRKFF